jgi:hypothetical protein
LKAMYPTVPVGALEATEIVVVDVAVLTTVEVDVAVTVLTAVVVLTGGDVTSDEHAELRSVDEKVLRGVGVVFVSLLLMVARRCSSVVII